MFLSIKQGQLFTNKSGFALLEVLLASSLFLIIVVFSVSAYLYGEEAVALSGNRQRAIFYADNNLEALYALKTTDFNSLTAGGPYYIATSSNNISLIPGELSVDIYSSSLSIGKIDDNRLIATSTVVWQQNEQRQGKVELVSYFSNWHRIISMIADWSNPMLESVSSLLAGVVGRDVKVINDYAYIITSGNNPNNSNFFIVDISSSTPVLISSIFVTRDLKRIIVEGDYAFIGSGNNQAEIQIVDISDVLNPAVISTYNKNGNRPVTSLAFLDDRLYFTAEQVNGNQNHEIFVLDVADINNPSLIFSTDLDDTPSDIQAVDNYVYISSHDNNEEFQVFEILGSGALNQISSLNLIGANNNSNALSLEFSSLKNIAYVAREDAYVYFIDLSDKYNPQLINSPALFISGIPSDLKLFNNENYLAVSNSQIDQELKIYDVSDPLFPIELSTLDLAGIDVEFLPQALDYSSDYDKLLLVGETTEQLQIVIPGL